MRNTRVLVLLGCLLLCAPTAQAQTEPVLSVVFDVIIPLPAEPDHIQFNPSPDSAMGCKVEGTITGKDNGFAFSEPDTEAGCAEAWFNIPVPAGATRAVVHFTADRQITNRGLSAIAPRMVQDLKIGGADWHRIFDPYAGSGTASGPAPEYSLLEDPDLLLRWRFSDEAQTESSPAVMPAAGHRFDATVTRPAVHFPDIPAQIRPSLESYAVEPASTLTRHRVLFEVAPGPDTVDVRILPTGASITAIFGPDGVPIEVPGAGNLPGWLTLPDAAPGTYEVVLDSISPRPAIFLPALPLLAVAAPTLAGIGAVGSNVAWVKGAHGSQRRSLLISRGVLGLLLVAYAAFAFYALGFGARAMGTVPATTLGWAGLVTAIVLTGGFLVATWYYWIQRRHALEHAHADRLTEANRRLERSNRDLGHFAAVASHDLKAPLRRVVTLTQMVQSRLAGTADNDLDEVLRMTVENGIHMQRLIEDLLAYSRLDQRLQPSEVSISEVVDGVRFDRGPEFAAVGGELAIQGDATIMGTPSLLRELVGNLVSNSLRYRRPDVPLKVVVETRVQGDEAVISVTDNGQGIPPQHHKRIFDMFERVHAQVDHDPGTGIGLSTCRRIAELHGGWIAVQSVVNEGTTFSVHLPLDP